MTALPEDVRALFAGPKLRPRRDAAAGRRAAHGAGVDRVGRRPDRLPHEPDLPQGRNLGHDPRVAISVTRHDQPFSMAEVRGRVTERLEGHAAFAVIDRISEKYIGGPYPLRTGRVVFLVEPEHAWGQTFG